MTSQDWFNPSVHPPATLAAAPSTAPTATDIRPLLIGTHSTPLLQGGGGYLTDQQMLNPGALPPVGPSPTSSIYGGADLLSTFDAPLLRGGRRRTLRRRGGGYLMPQQWYNPDVKDPVGFAAPLTTAASPDATRPVLVSTFLSPLLGAGRRGKTRRGQRGGMRGGFSPSVMGSFAANAQAAIVPLALYGVYKMVVPEKKTGSKKRSKTPSKH